MLGHLLGPGQALQGPGVLASWSLMTLGLMNTVVEASDMGFRVRLGLRSGRCLSGDSCSQAKTGQPAKGTADGGERSGCRCILGSTLAVSRVHVADKRENTLETLRGYFHLTAPGVTYPHYHNCPDLAPIGGCGQCEYRPTWGQAGPSSGTSLTLSSSSRCLWGQE